MINKCNITRIEWGIISIAGSVFDFVRTQFNIIGVSFKEVDSWHSDFGLIYLYKKTKQKYEDHQ